MPVQIFAKNFKLTPDIRKHVEHEIANLVRLAGKAHVTETPIEVGLTSLHHRKGKIHRAEIMLHLPGEILRAEEEAEDLHQAINIAKEEMESQIKKYRTKCTRGLGGLSFRPCPKKSK